MKSFYKCRILHTSFFAVLFTRCSNLAVIILIFLFGEVRAQSTNEAQEQRFQFGVNFSPDVTYRVLNPIVGDPTSSFLVESRNEMEVPKLGVTFGVNMQFHLNRSWSIETSVHYSNMGYSFENSDFIYKDEEDDMLKRIYSVVNHNFIEIPLKVNYFFGKKDKRFFVSSGIVNNVLINSNERRAEYYQNSTNHRKFYFTESLSRYNVSFLLSSGIDFKLSPTRNFRLEPTFRYALFSLSQTNQEQLYNIGLNIGYFFEF
jgi:hypothetical protein